MDDLSPVVLGALLMWLVVLTLVAILSVRQIALLTVRLDARGESFSVGDDGLDVGTPVDPWLTDALPELATGRAYLMHVSSSCGSCRELIPDLGEQEYPAPMFALLTGGGAVADRLAEEFPTSWKVVRGEDAAKAVQLLNVHSTPFTLQIEKGVVTGKAYVRVVQDLRGLIEAYDESDAAEIAERVRAREDEREGVVAHVD